MTSSSKNFTQLSKGIRPHSNYVLTFLTTSKLTHYFGYPIYITWITVYVCHSYCMHHMYKKLQNYYILSSLPISQKLQTKLVQFMNVGPKGLFSTPFSISLVFSLEPNKRKFHFSPYFSLIFFHFHVFIPTKHILSLYISNIMHPSTFLRELLQ